MENDQETLGKLTLPYVPLTTPIIIIVQTPKPQPMPATIISTALQFGCILIGEKKEGL